jgi:hypothetical protein
VSARLLHYSSEPLGALYSCEQKSGVRGHRFDKPRGLWVSVEGEDDWRSWCEAESFGNPGAQHCYEIALASDANVLRIKSAPALLSFTRRYGYDPYVGIPGVRTIMSGQGIQWAAIAAKFDGIIIAPYQWSARLDDRTGWYYGWDCASGCIWNADAVASVRLVSDERAAA